jgi:hypothetical protein
MNLFRGTIVIALFAVAIGGCTPDPVFPVEPMLTFKEFIQRPGSDSLDVVFSFTDGDGDIGVAVNSSDSNMVLTAYHRDPASGLWVVVDNPNTANPLDSLCYTYRIPKLAAGQEGLEGDIYVTINKTFLALTEDTLQFNAFLLDQSRNRSPYVRTPEVVLVP